MNDKDNIFFVSISMTKILNFNALQFYNNCFLHVHKENSMNFLFRQVRYVKEKLSDIWSISHLYLHAFQANPSAMLLYMCQPPV